MIPPSLGNEYQGYHQACGASGQVQTGASGIASPELEISGKINRQDFGLTWDGKNAAGEIIVGDEIKLKARIQFTKVTALEKAGI